MGRVRGFSSANAKTPELRDYETSLHFKLEDKYVHAMDLRTVGRPEWKNRITDGYFRLMGFRTLRHVGTADHVHVSLPLRENGPGARTDRR